MQRWGTLSPLSFDFSPDYGADARESVAYVPQHPAMVNHWKVAELLPSPARFLGCFFPDDDPASLIHRRIGDFSGGQRNKLYACSALERLAVIRLGAVFLLLDETFDGLGATELSSRLVAIESSWTQQGHSALHLMLVSHLNDDDFLAQHQDALRLTLSVRERSSKHLRVEIHNKP